MTETIPPPVRRDAAERALLALTVKDYAKARWFLTFALGFLEVDPDSASEKKRLRDKLRKK